MPQENVVRIMRQLRRDLEAAHSVSAGPSPRYGTWTMLISVIILKSSPETWVANPMPPDAKLISPGWALA